MTGDVPLRLRVLNPPEANPVLRIGMTVRVELDAPAVEAIAVPEKALTVNEDGEHVVTLIKDNKAIETSSGTGRTRRALDLRRRHGADHQRPVRATVAVEKGYEARQG